MTNVKSFFAIRTPACFSVPSGTQENSEPESTSSLRTVTDLAFWRTPTTSQSTWKMPIRTFREEARFISVIMTFGLCPAQEEGGVVPSESVGARDRDVDPLLARAVGDVVEIALGVGVGAMDGRGDHARCEAQSRR